MEEDDKGNPALVEENPAEDEDAVSSNDSDSSSSSSSSDEGDDEQPDMPADGPRTPERFDEGEEADGSDMEQPFESTEEQPLPDSGALDRKSVSPTNLSSAKQSATGPVQTGANEQSQRAPTGPRSPLSEEGEVEEEDDEMNSPQIPLTPPTPQEMIEDDEMEPQAHANDDEDDDHISLNGGDDRLEQNASSSPIKTEPDVLSSSNKVKRSSTSIENADDNIELDYDIDLAQDAADTPQNESTDILDTSTAAAESEEAKPSNDPELGNVKPKVESSEAIEKKKVKLTKPKPPKTKKEPDESEEEGELSDSDGELTTSDEEGGIVEEEVEDGEIKDGRNFTTRLMQCKFFMRGQCTWGYNCRFLHPGVNDKGNYQMIERPGMRPRPQGMYKPADTEPESKAEEEDVEEPEKELPKPVEPPKPETPWERGLRQAKEALKRASRKKEMELDIEDKKMNMTLDDVKGKDKEHRPDDPYYDNLQYDELDPIQATAFEDYNRDDNWEKAGFEETFDVGWTQANYELPHMQQQHHHHEREWRDDRMRQERDSRRGYDRGGGRQRYRSPPRNARRNYRDMPDERRGLNRQALGADGWVDPWQRVKPGERRRNRRRSSSGSSSFSSLSRSSRHSSASSFSSRSRSRTRTPTPLRNIAKPKSVITQMNASKADDKRPKDQLQPSQLRAQRKGPEWPSGPPTNGDRQMGPQRDRMGLPLSEDKYEKSSNEVMGASAGRPSRKTQPPGARKDKNKFKRRNSSASSSSSSSGSSSSRSHSSSSSGSSDSSSSSGSSSDGSSTSDSSASDSDDLYAGMSKPKKDRHKRAKVDDVKRAKGPQDRLNSSRLPPPINRKQQGDPVRETTTSTSKAGIKLTLVNKAKVPSRKRVLDSPPPEQLPPSKKASLPLPERAERPKTGVKAPTAVPPVTVKTKALSSPVKSAPAAAKPASKPASKPAAASNKKAQPNRREELLKQLKAVEEAIAKKRSKT